MYIVWTKDNYGDQWQREDCDDQVAVRDSVLAATKEGRDWEVTQPVEVHVKVEIKAGPMADSVQPRTRSKKTEDKKTEEENVETPESGPEENQDPGDPGHGTV